MSSRGNTVNLHDALLDTPKVHGHMSQLEATLPPFRDYVTLLRDTFQACQIHQEKAGEGTRALANLLSSIDSEVGEKTSSTSSSAFAQLARYQSELYSCQEMLNSQLQNSVVNRVSTLLDEDMDNLQGLKEANDSCRIEHEHAMAKFSRTSKRRDSDKSRFEANADLYAARKKFFQSTLDYCSQLNEFQIKKRFMLLEPVLTFMHAQMGYYKACHEIMNSGFQQLLTELNSDIMRYHREFENEVRELQQQKTELELQFPSLCLPDPDLADPFTEFPTANTELTSKYGYLYLRIQKGGLAAKWERTFFFTKNGYLYTQSLHKGAEQLLHLKEAEAFSSDGDDRRYVMQITHHALKKPVYLQAESDTQRTEWISVINNNSSRRAQHGAIGGQSPDASRIRTRLYDSLERERIRTWATKELQQESTTPSSSSLKVATPPSRPRHSRSPLRGTQKTTTGSGSQDSKSTQRGLGLRGWGGGKKTTSVPTLPPAISSGSLPVASSVGSKLADVESWVDSTTAATVTPSPPPRPLHPPPSTSSSKHNPTPSQNGGPVSVKFSVKYLGQMEVQDPNNSSAIDATIRGVMQARARKKVKPAESIELAILLKKITLTEILSNKAIGAFLLKDIMNCAPHPEDKALFGVICRTTLPTEPDRTKFICHVMQADQSGAQVCKAIRSAIQTLWKMMQNKDSASVTATSQGPLFRPPPPVAPYSGTLNLNSYTPAPGGLAANHRLRTSAGPGSLHHARSASLPSQYRSSSNSNLPALPPRPGGRGLVEEVGVAGSGSLSTLPPSLPVSSSASAESLSLGRVDDEDHSYINTDSPLMFTDILEESEDLPLIMFDQNILGGVTLDSSATADGYVTSNTGGSSASGGFSSPTPSGNFSTNTLTGGGISASSGYVSAPQPSPSPSPTPPQVTSTQLPLPPRTASKLSPSPPPPPSPSPVSPVTSSRLTPTTPTSNPPSHKRSPPPPPLPSSGTSMHDTPANPSKPISTTAVAPSAKQKEATNSKTVHSTPGTTTPAANSRTQQPLNPKTISPSDSSEKEKDKATTTTVTSSTTDPLAEAFGFDTTPEDIENLIELMGPSDMYPQHGSGKNHDSGYMAANGTQSESYTDWSNF